MSKKIRLTYGHFNWVNLVLSTDLPFQSKAICLYLATFMNSKQEVAWPSQARIVKELGISHSSLNRSLNIVEMAGWIIREKGDHKTNTRYYTAFPKGLEKELLGSSPDELGSPTGGLGSPTQGLGVVPQGDTNKQVNKQTNNYSVQFEEFWKLYPRKLARKKAEESFKKAVKVVDSKDIIAGLKKYLTVWAGKEHDFIPHASTWLNQHRWEDEINPIAKPNGLDLTKLKGYK